MRKVGTPLPTSQTIFPAVTDLDSSVVGRVSFSRDGAKVIVGNVHHDPARSSIGETVTLCAICGEGFVWTVFIVHADKDLRGCC
jgi:hypothetical protein